MQQKTLLTLSLTVLIFLFINSDTFKKNYNSITSSDSATMPKPTEIVQKDKDDKSFKKRRKQWEEDRNKTAEGDNWREIDAQYRQKKHARIEAQRQRLWQQGLLKTNGFEEVANGHLTGEWRERGSKNQAGRLHTCDIDFDNNLIYAASSGGILWRGNMDGTDWTSLNDYRSFYIHSVRVVYTDGNMGCSPTWELYQLCAANGGTYNPETKQCEGCVAFETAEEAQGPCGEGQVMDCAGNCIPVDQFNNWIGDGYCDDGTYGAVFTCDQFDNDGEDCGTPSSGCSAAWLKYQLCLAAGGEYNIGGGTCSVPIAACGAFSNSQQAQGACPNGQIMDCDGNCFDSEFFGAISNGECQDGNQTPNFKCVQYQNDGEDCGLVKRIIVAGNGVLYTDNEGATWNTSAGLMGTVDRMVTANDANETIYVLTTSGGLKHLYRSTNQGANFHFLYTFPTNNGDIWASRYGSGDLYAVNGEETYRLIAGTDTPVVVGSVNPSSTGYTLLVGGESEDGVFLYSYIDGKIYASKNGGSTWSFKSDAPENPFGRNSLGCSTSNPNRVYIGGVNAFRSYNSGAFWSQVNVWSEYYGDPQGKLHADIDGIDTFKDTDGSDFVMVSTDGGLYRSDNDLLTVDNRTLSGIGVGQYYSVYTCKFDPKVIYIGSQDQGFQRTRLDFTGEGLVDFEQTISGDYGNITSLDEGASFWTVYPGFAMYYPDAINSNSNRSWDFANDGDGFQWMSPLMADPNGADKVFIGGSGASSGQHLWHLNTNGGTAMIPTELPFDFSSSGSITALEYDSEMSEIRYVMTNNGDLFRTNNSGNSWMMVWDGPNSMRGNDIIPSKLNAGTVYIAGSGYSNAGVMVSTDYGDTFEPMIEGLPSTNVNQLALTPDEDLLFAATNVGAFVYVFADAQWYDIGGISAPDQDYRTVDFVPATGTVRFATYGRGIWDFALACYAAPTQLSTLSVSTHAATLQWKNTIGANAYQVDYRPLGGNEWTTLFTADNTLTLENLEGGTEYEFTVKATCGSNNTMTSETGTFTTYCAAMASNTEFGWIDQIRLNELDNLSGNDGGYGEYLTQNTLLLVGIPYQLQLIPAFPTFAASQYWKVWADWNGDGDFDEESELLFASENASEEALTVDLQLSQEISEGTVVLRIAMQFDEPIADACSAFTYGEVEDYTLTIKKYCTATGSNTSWEWIAGVAIGDYLHESEADNGFGDYSDEIIELTAGESYPLMLTPGFSNGAYEEYWRMWIDFNANGEFEETELVFDAGDVSTEAVNGEITIPESVTNTYTKMRIAMRYGGAATACQIFGDGEVEEYTVRLRSTEARLQLKVMLEGVYDAETGGMSTDLRQKNLVPLAQPFNRMPWNYAGMEVLVNADLLPENVVDWVLVEIRDANDASSILEQKAALLLQDGSIADPRDPMDMNGLRFDSKLEDISAVFVSIKTRNHLAVLSAQTVTLPTTAPFDLTNPNNVSGGASQLAELENGQFALLSGDFNSDGIVSVEDFNFFHAQLALLNFYVDGDCNLDGMVNVRDYNLYRGHSSVIGVEEIRY
ncbi:MAG: GEVED domain-containing protein [Chitinophagales bacterium]